MKKKETTNRIEGTTVSYCRLFQNKSRFLFGFILLLWISSSGNSSSSSSSGSSNSSGGGKVCCCYGSSNSGSVGHIHDHLRARFC